MKRTVAAFLVGVVVGTGVWAAVNPVQTTLWRHAGRWLAIVGLLLFGLLVSFGPYGAFVLSPFSLEGMWTYPLGLTPLAAAAWLIWSPCRKLRPGLWDLPPGPR